MAGQSLLDRLKSKFGNKISGANLEAIDPWIEVDPVRVEQVAQVCKTDEALRFDFLSCLCGVDAHDSIYVVYHLVSYPLRHSVVLKVKVHKGKPVTHTVTTVWRGANWHERETYDLFGVRFEGHPDLRRILLPDDWEGYPLRKEYIFPTEYGGIENTRDYSF